MKDNSGNKDLLIERIVEIAHNLDGKNEDMFEQTGDRLRDALGRISDWFEEYKMGTAKELPNAEELDNGLLLGTEDGCWVPQSISEVVNFSSGDNDTLIADKTNAEIAELMTHNKLVLASYGDLVVLLSAVASTGEIGIFEGIGILHGNGYDRLADFVPISTDADNDVWEMNEYNLRKLMPFYVTLTPTAPDMSGTMDRTPQEISGAYDEGWEIIFRIENPAFDWMNLKPSLVSKVPHRDYYCFQANLIDWTQSPPVLINVWTNDDSNSTYSTHIYALTEV